MLSSSKSEQADLIFESDPAAQRRGAALSLVIGVALVWLCKRGVAGGGGDVTLAAAFWLGGLLALIGAGLLVLGGKRVVSVEVRRRVVRIYVIRWLGDTSSSLGFQDIVSLVLPVLLVPNERDGVVRLGLKEEGLF